MRLIPLLAVAGAAAYFYNRYRKSHGAGSTTNASDAVDDIDLASNPSQDEMLDAGVQ